MFMCGSLWILGDIERVKFPRHIHQRPLNQVYTVGLHVCMYVCEYFVG